MGLTAVNTEIDTAGPSLPARRTSRVRAAIGWIISIACIAVIAYNVDFDGVLAALGSFQWPYLLIALVSLAAGYTMRVARWAVMLRATGTPVTLRQCAAPFLGSIALNNVLPLRAGDIVRATIFPGAIGVPRAAAIGSIVMERLVDLLTLLLCLAIGAVWLGADRLPDWLANGAILLAVGGIGVMFAILLFSGTLAQLLARLAATRPPAALATRVLVALSNLLVGFRQMSGARVLALVFGLSMLAWLGEAGVYWSLMVGFGLEAHLLAALMVMAFVTLSTLVPSSPGYVGPFHLAAFAAITLLGGTEEIATSYAVLAHLMVWVPTTLAGGLAMLLSPEIFRGAVAQSGATAA